MSATMSEGAPAGGGDPAAADDAASDVHSLIDSLADLHQAFGEKQGGEEERRHYLDDVRLRAGPHAACSRCR
jgi:hypothetical protein